MTPEEHTDEDDEDDEKGDRDAPVDWKSGT